MRNRVSIVNCVSTAIDMLKFSTDAIILNAGYDFYDYIVVKWNSTPEVDKYLEEQKRIMACTPVCIHIIEHQTDFNVGYVPNLRGMMNDGFNYGFKLNDYCGLTNTDMYFGKCWLGNLVKYASEDLIVNSVHITPSQIPQHVQANLGIPEYGKFRIDEFNRLYKLLYKDTIVSEDDVEWPYPHERWRNINSMPYLFHKKYWEKCGPWGLRHFGGLTPDAMFFGRCSQAGAKFVRVNSSIVYHYEAVERTGRRPSGTENMAEEY